MKMFLSVGFALMSLSSFGQTGSEIFLFDLKEKKGAISLSNPKNITNHIGYDNQPSFHADQPIVYYTSFNAEGRADINYFNYKTGETLAFTQTPEREYSPTLTPDKKYISCIIQRDNNAQDLGKYPVEGGAPVVLIDNLTVGYHRWIDQDRLLLFVLGEPQTLHLYNVKTREDKILDNHIGRSLHAIPGKKAMSYIKKNTETEWMIMQLDTETLVATKLLETLPKREDLCWTPEGRVIMSDGSKIYSIDPYQEKQWKEMEIQSGKENLKGVTRLAVNQKGNRLAVVVAE